MKENNFIEQNKEKWLEFEEENSKKVKDPAKLSRLFVQVTDDLSYARSFYKNRQVRYVLNAMAQSLFLSIYKRDRLGVRNVLNFWKTTLPLAIYQVRRELLISFLVFALSFFIGMLSSANDPNFSRMILSEEYVDMTLENIKKGEPLGVYKKMGEMDMMFSITLNNLMVSAITFVLGVFASVGALMAMVRNGVMVGCFQHFFIERGLFWDSFLTIWQHGTLEISSIIIAGGAGIVLGKGLLFPGTYTRMQAFRISGKKGMVVLAGIAPIIVIAAFIESFFTRYTELPDIVRLFVIIASLAFVLFYFVFYPRHVARKAGALSDVKEDVEYREFSPFNLNEVHSGGQLFESVLRLFGHHFSSFFKKIILLSLAYIAVWGTLKYWVLGNLSTPVQNVSGDVDVWQWGFDLLFSVVAYLVFFYSVYKLSYQPKMEKISKTEFLKRSILPVVVCSGIISAGSFIPNEYGAFFVNILLVPIFLCMAFWWQNEKKSPVPHFFSMLKGEYISLWWLVLKFLIIAFLLELLVSTESFHLFPALLWNLYFDDQNMTLFISLFTVWTSKLIYVVACALTSISVGLFTFNMKERYTASVLKSRIEGIGKQFSVRGFKRE